MATLTIRIPEDKAERLKELAAQRGISVNKLFDEWATMAISEFDAHSRFLARAARGSRERGLSMLAELERRDAQASTPQGFHEAETPWDAEGSRNPSK
ncbi:MAG: ribbon-helix-helix protein, CopG family [Alphaproteobacteria bacterium]|nr:ribbon-helix-helix protein, CopG family [Alphaproteobacteria bacterium]